jgi:translation initiation factor 2 subunit 2
MESYEDLLSQAYKDIKPIESNGERFEIPKIQGHVEGTKTVLTNLPQIASTLRREQEHILKFLLKELATSGKIQGNKVVLQTKISSAKINSKIEQYTNEFVLCKECKKPDTEIIKQDRLSFVHCLACGAKHSIRAKI